jgi:hypothetical protein
MTSKSWLAAAAILAVPSLAFAAGGDRDAKVEWQVGATPDTSAQRTVTQASPQAPVARASGTVQASQAELKVVAMAAKAHAAKNAGGKPSEQPTAKSGATGSQAKAGAKAGAEMKVVAMAAKAHAAKNAGGKPSEQPTAKSGATGGAKAGPTGNAEVKVVAMAAKAHAAKNASGRPSESPRAQRSGSFGGHSSFGGRAPSFGGRGGSPVGARASFGRMPAERGSHCNARGMCF